MGGRAVNHSSDGRWIRSEDEDGQEGAIRIDAIESIGEASGGRTQVNVRGSGEPYILPIPYAWMEYYVGAASTPPGEGGGE